MKYRLRILIGEVVKSASLKPFKKKDASFRASLTDKIHEPDNVIILSESMNKRVHLKIT